MKKLIWVSAIVMFILSISFFVAYAQYQTQQTANVTFDPNGLIHVGQSSTVGSISIDIAGTPGVTGSVSTATYNANPQTGASIPSGVTIAHFIVVSFGIPAHDFQSANITISYTASDVAGLNQPYSIYKYNANTNGYLQLPSTVDTNAKTITATVTSINDPLLAIGGESTSPSHSSGIPSWTWIAVISVILVVIVVAVFFLTRRHPSN